MLPQIRSFVTQILDFDAEIACNVLFIERWWSEILCLTLLSMQPYVILDVCAPRQMQN